MYWMSRNGCWEKIDGLIFRDSRTYETQAFKFGYEENYNSKLNHRIQIKIGKSYFLINVSVIDTEIPLLLGTDFQKMWGIVVDIGRKQVFLRETNEYVKVEQSKTHRLKLPIQGSKTWVKVLSSVQRMLRVLLLLLCHVFTPPRVRFVCL